MRRSYYVFAGILLILVIGLVAYSLDSDRLETLKSDPMASVVLPDAVEVRVTESQGNSGIGVQSPATVVHMFTVAPGTVPEAIADLAQQARDAGWTLREQPLSGFAGDKFIDGLFAQISINGNEDSNKVWVEVMTMDS